jgi:hypothetical protein
LNYYDPLDKQVSQYDESLTDEKDLSVEQVIFPPNFGPGTRPTQPGPMPTQPGPMPAQPLAPPPNFIPALPQSTQEPESFRLGGQLGGNNIRFCLNRYTYMWLFNGNNFWFYPTFIGRNSVEGFRWRRNGWTYERINLRQIFFSLCF